MEARALWLLVAVLAVGSSSSSAQYLGLCESCSDALHSTARGGLVAGREPHGEGHGRLGAFCGLKEGDEAPMLI